MKSLLFLFPVLFLMNANSSSLEYENKHNNDYYELTIKEDGSYIIDSLLDDSLSNYRLYHIYGDGENEYLVSEVNSDLFLNLNHDVSVLISKDIDIIPSSLFNNHVSFINYTGSQSEWESLNLNVTQDVYYYQGDEGFINYWNDVVRINPQSDVCSMSKADYLTLKNMYDDLTAEEKLFVNPYVDKANQTIEDTMTYLNKYFSDESQSNNQPKRNLPQDMTIGFIVSVAIFGMTIISIFYILKQQGIIN